jgi:hypothetical protein
MKKRTKKEKGRRRDEGRGKDPLVSELGMTIFRGRAPLFEKH